MVFSFDQQNFPPSLEDELFEMANLRPETTGLPFIVWISPGLNARHDIRVKVSPTPHPGPEMTSVALRPHIRVTDGPALSPEHLRLLTAWAHLNFDVLLDFWEGRLAYTEDVLAHLKKIG